MDKISDELKILVINYNVLRIMFPLSDYTSKYQIHKQNIKEDIFDLLKEELNLGIFDQLPEEISNIYMKLLHIIDEIEKYNDDNYNNVIDIEKKNKEFGLYLRQLCNIMKNKYNKPNCTSSLWFEKLHKYYNAIRLT